jgi:hypothetical protein
MVKYSLGTLAVEGWNIRTTMLTQGSKPYLFYSILFSLFREENYNTSAKKETWIMLQDKAIQLPHAAMSCALSGLEMFIERWKKQPF